MTDESEVWARMRAIYDGFLAADTEGVDALLQRDVTISDSAEFPLTRGLEQLREMRSRRRAIRGLRRSYGLMPRIR